MFLDDVEREERDGKQRHHFRRPNTFHAPISQLCEISQQSPPGYSMRQGHRSLPQSDIKTTACWIVAARMSSPETTWMVLVLMLVGRAGRGGGAEL